MIPRAPQCDDDRCDYDENGRWVHVPGCWAVEEADGIAWLDDAADRMAADAANEDGYATPYGRRPIGTVPRQRKGEAA